MDGTTRIGQTLEQILPQIRKTQKHKLSPTDESDSKKIKKEQNGVEPKQPNPIEELNRRISEGRGNLSCVDTRSPEEIASLRQSRIFCGLSENSNIPYEVIVSCDNLGQDLANTLISNGALDVMKVTQDIIRTAAAAQKS